jgi:ferredoxin--NADP+ reductase
MSKNHEVKVTSVTHWNETLFSFKVTRPAGFRFANGQFVMIGLIHNDKNILRAYSMASPNYEDELEFFSIKVADGELTSKLQLIKIGDTLIMGERCHGTLVDDNLLEGKNLYLLSTGTGLAPFMSIIQDPEIYERYEKVILVHGCRFKSELAYQELIKNELPNNEYFGDMVRDKLIYYPSVTREEYTNNGRITDLIKCGKLFSDIGLSTPTLADDRFMICGNQFMLKDFADLLESKGFKEAKDYEKGHFVVERAFVEK